MFLTIAGFELKRRLRGVSTWIYFAVFLLLAFFQFIASAGACKNMGTGGGNVKVNAPHTLAGFISLLSYMMVLVMASISGQAVHQDVLHNTQPLFFTAPIRKLDYLG